MDEKQKIKSFTPLLPGSSGLQAGEEWQSNALYQLPWEKPRPLGRGVTGFTDLVAWKEGHALGLVIYAAPQEFPKE